MDPKAKEVKDKGQEKDEKLIFDMTDKALLTISTKELNKLVKNHALSQEETLKLKHRRRLLKNREYAARKREKRHLLQREITTSKEKLIKQHEQLKKALLELDNVKARLEAHADELP